VVVPPYCLNNNLSKNMKIALYRTLPFLAAGLLLGCTRGEPTTADFLANAEIQMAQGRSLACLPLSLSGSYTSLLGGLPDGWVTIGGQSQTGYGYNLTEQLERANALAAGGLLAKDKYEVYQDGQLTPVSRYQLTDKGREATRSDTNSYGGGACVYAGKWVATGLVKPKAGEQEVTKTQNGETVSYSAEVQFALQDTPAWLKDPAIRAAFSRNLQEWTTPRPQKVELVQFEGKWVAKRVLASQMLGEGTSSAGEGRRTATKIAQADQESMLLRITDQANTRSRSVLKLPVRASETPPDYASTHPGVYFFAATPDAKASSPMNSLRMAQVRAELLARNPASAPIAPVQAVQQTPQAVLAAARENDTYLTQRKELLETMEALVKAGAMLRKDVTAADVPGASGPGVLYVPAEGVSVAEGGLSLGFVQVKGPLEQTVRGPMLTLTASYTPLERAPWLEKAAEQLPQLKRRLAGGKATAVFIQGTADAPQLMNVTLN
jgi:hypothetical protein